MNTIKFSHDYQKLPIGWEGSHALLIGVASVNLEWLKTISADFIRRDIEYRGEAGFFDFNFNDAIVLTFLHIKTGIIFTTIRRYIDTKYDYYTNNLMKVFKMMRIEEKNG